MKPNRWTAALLGLALVAAPLCALAQGSGRDVPSYSVPGQYEPPPPDDQSGPRDREPMRDQQPPPDQPPPPRGGRTVSGSLQGDLDSKSAYVGERIVLKNAAASDGSFTDATLYGEVTDVTPPGQGRNAQIRMHFDTLRWRDGSQQRIDGVVESMNVQTKNNAAKEAAGAIAGMLIGNAIGKTLFGISGGGLIGAAGGFFVAKDNRSNVVIPGNSLITVRLADPRRQAQ